jgi:iduronate 2-sulfatase
MKPVARISLLLAGLITASEAAHKNVLFIAVDDLKPVLGAYGHPYAKTPNIDRLAARGLLFESAYTNQALCSPSRNALLTGVRPSTLGIYELSTNFRKAAPDAITLPQQLQKSGYRTEAIGKIFHVGQGNHDDTLSWSVPTVRPAAPTYALKESQLDGAAKEGPGKQRGAAYESADVPDDTYADGKIADETIRRLEAAKTKPETPFFIAAGFLRPHLPFVSPKKYWDLYDPSVFKLPGFRKAPEGSPAVAFRNNGELASYKGTHDSDNLSDEQQLKLLHGYFAAVSYTDAQVGKLLDALDRLGLSENTIIVLWGDHGWHLGDHGLWAKMTNFEQATRIPLIISAPGVTSPGTKSKALAQSIDLYPTLVDLTGVPSPATTPKLEGTSLVPVLKDPAAKVHEDVLQVLPRQGQVGRSLRTATHRFVEWKKPGADTAIAAAEIELYDYTADPEEKKNLATANPEVVASLRQRLATYPEAKSQIAIAKEKEEEAPAPAADGKQDRAALFKNRDKDNNGQLTREEFLVNQKNPATAEKRLGTFDRNGDGLLSREEFISAGK